MAETITADEIMKRHAALAERMQELVRATAGGGAEAGERAVAMAAQIQREAQALESLARTFEAQQQKTETPRGYIQVRLTPQQTQRVREEVGVEMDVLLIQDSKGTMNLAMPVMTPDTITELALQEARRRKQAKDVGAEAQAQIQSSVAELERYPHVKEKLDELRKDPNYLGGLLK